MNSTQVLEFEFKRGSIEFVVGTPGPAGPPGSGVGGGALRSVIDTVLVSPVVSSLDLPHVPLPSSLTLSINGVRQRNSNLLISTNRVSWPGITDLEPDDLVTVEYLY